MASITETAQRLIHKYGRSITLVRLDGVAPDISKPWRTPTPRAEAVETEVIGVFVPLSSRTNLGAENYLSQDTIRGEQVCLVSGLDSTTDLRNTNEIIDTSGTRWKVLNAQVLQPGSTLHIYAFEVRQ